MVGRDYELGSVAPPDALKRWFDQAAVPAAIDAFGAIETILDRVAGQTTRRPLRCVGLALAAGALAAALTRVPPTRR